jgi:NAD(P)-dependent dehydrogenase (short-subunit alcohol dehydrogenase family)
MTLADRVVVVTGGARGIGRVLIEGFLRERSRVVAIDLSWDGEEVFKKEVEHGGGITLSADVRDDASIERAFVATTDAFGTVDVLVNNAGLRQRDMVPWMYVKTLDLDLEKWQLMIDVNLLGPLRVTRQFVKPMLEQRRGSIINVGSITGDYGIAGMQPYAMTKAALKNWTLSLAQELKEFDVAVNVFSPGMSWTTGSGEAREEQKRVLGMTSFPPIYRPESCVPLVLMLAQQDARLTGHWIPDVIEWNLLHGLGGHDVWVHED